jgi:hypothetical protein
MGLILDNSYVPGSAQLKPLYAVQALVMANPENQGWPPAGHYYYLSNNTKSSFIDLN